MHLFEIALIVSARPLENIISAAPEGVTASISSAKAGDPDIMKPNASAQRIFVIDRFPPKFTLDTASLDIEIGG